MTEQKLTVTGLYRPGWHRWSDLGQVPYLPFTGKWLAEAGFLAGTRVSVEVVEDGELVIHRVEEGEMVEAHQAAGRCVAEYDEQLGLLELEAVHG